MTSKTSIEQAMQLCVRQQALTASTKMDTDLRQSLRRLKTLRAHGGRSYFANRLRTTEVAAAIMYHCRKANILCDISIDFSEGCHVLTISPLASQPSISSAAASSS